MAIPDAIKTLIDLAKSQELAENQLESLKNEKINHQNAIQSLNQQITDQSAVVSAARVALKAAAQAI